ncbi:MAG: hypothetical protein JJT75_08400 [Opitutales bacterium]|nr:hypothetical protein [Opitutales bacterium]MCH8540542.1 hypothetical protein [Opitutales bacterium]
MKRKLDFLSFPAGLLQEEPLRLDILRETDDWLALHKPAGLAAIRRGYGKEKHYSIGDALQGEYDRGKPQLQAHGFDGIHSLCAPAYEVEGIYLLAKNPACRRSLREAMGSGQFSFHYQFWSAPRPELPDQLECHLPVARHRQEDRALVSHRTGKKATTLFRRLHALPGGDYWESTSPFDRWHQVRLHAAESGFPPLLDSLYGGAEELPFEWLKILPRRQPAFPSLYQSTLLLPDEPPLTLPPPRIWKKLQNSLTPSKHSI